MNGLSQIKHENGRFWVMEKSGLYYVMKQGLTHSQSVDGVAYRDLSIAIARCDYLAKGAQR